MKKYGWLVVIVVSLALANVAHLMHLACICIEILPPLYMSIVTVIEADRRLTDSTNNPLMSPEYVTNVRPETIRCYSREIRA